MKKILLFFIFLGLSLSLTGCSSKYLEKINISELNDKIDKKETFVIYFYDDDYKLENTLTNVLEKNNIIGYKIDTSKITDEERLNLQTKIDYEKPSIVFVIDGKDPSKLAHIKDEDARENRILAALKDMNFIK